MKKHSYKDRSLIVDQCFTDSFDRMDLIEARVREAVFTAAEIATRLTALGVEACATIVSLNKDPVVSVYGFSLTIDEASDLIRRFDPKWNGQAYDRCWEGLPSDDFSLEKLEEAQRAESYPQCRRSHRILLCLLFKVQLSPCLTAPFPR